ncbi:uncharacterized protein LOC122721523 [Manihot esculenta]|uniref:uncharacterized protein LOC122721523 n=1 Tax=Manihot esculenta TaxID=3983 RepID=UPI001CC45533|nr:uncharacterized protein LOC122721523 [Manihot esculenta]
MTVLRSRCKLKTSQFSSIGQKVAGLKKLYNSVDDCLLSQQSHSHEQQSQCVEEALSVSLKLLDMCNTTKDILSQMRECFQGLESSLPKNKTRRVWLERQENNCTTTFSDNSDMVNMINILKAAEETSLAVLEPILSFISQSSANSKLSGWFLVSKIIQSKRFERTRGIGFKSSGSSGGLECIYRRLVNIRVSLLNILNQ